MAVKTYKVRALVLRKTKLAEKDLVVTLLAEDGSLVKAVAKGARKPGGSFAARMELFSTVDLMLAQGRSLDVVCEARLADEAAKATFGLEQATCAAPLAELLCAVAQPALAQPRVFDLSRAAFSRIGAFSDQPREALKASTAALWKVMAQIGFKPSFSQCALCGGEADVNGAGTVAVSVAEGGVVCDACPRPADALIVSADTVRWCDALIRLRFDDIANLDIGAAALSDALQLVRSWIRVHTGKNLKSLDFLFVSGLFD